MSAPLFVPSCPFFWLALRAQSFPDLSMA